MYQCPCPHHTETNQLICSADQLTGVYIKETLVAIGLRIIIDNCFLGDTQRTPLAYYVISSLMPSPHSLCAIKLV